jgi:hypothetical protein
MTRPMMISMLLSGFALSAVFADAQAETLRFYGYATDLKSGKYLYTEVHQQNVEGDRWLGGTIRYYAPDGHSIADKKLDFSIDPYVPKYSLEIPKEGYVEAITAVSASSLTMEKTSHGKTESKMLDKKPNMAADAGFHSTIVAHFDELQAGKTVPFVLAVAGQLDSYKFRVKKTGDTTFDGQPAIKLIVEPDSLLRMVADPLLLTYSTTKRLVEYRGISNMHDPASGDAYNVRIVYPEKPPKDAPATLPPLE